MSTQSKIILHREISGWTAQFCGPAAEDVIAAMGTDTVPTAFTAKAPEDKVRAAIAALNPGIPVEVRI